MSNKPPARKSKHINRYGEPIEIPSMATPRRPQPSSKGNILGIIFFIIVLAGIVWLTMFLFGLGPYLSEGAQITPTLTDIPVVSLTASQTLMHTHTLQPAVTSTVTATPTVTPTPTLELRPFVQDGEQEATNIELIRPELNCNWLVVAGQVWDLQGDPIPGLTLHLFGQIAGFSIDQVRVSGSAPAYGDSGFEFALEGLVLASQDSLVIQLEDTNGLPLSHPYTIETFEDCQRNLILVNFKKVR
ncbi:MAG: hypothetical protein U9R53_10590 [Chloroflexota bacterium]|nr:hypothetical protein [Chloroflexota bacterium]